MLCKFTYYLLLKIIERYIKRKYSLLMFYYLIENYWKNKTDYFINRDSLIQSNNSHGDCQVESNKMNKQTALFGIDSHLRAVLRELLCV